MNRIKTATRSASARLRAISTSRPSPRATHSSSSPWLSPHSTARRRAVLARISKSCSSAVPDVAGRRALLRLHKCATKLARRALGARLSSCCWRKAAEAQPSAKCRHLVELAEQKGVTLFASGTALRILRWNLARAWLATRRISSVSGWMWKEDVRVWHPRPRVPGSEGRGLGVRSIPGSTPCRS